MVRIHPDPPLRESARVQGRAARRKGGPDGAVAQLGERLLCKQEVVGSIPSSSTSSGVRHQVSGIRDPQWMCAAPAVRKVKPRDQTPAARPLLPSGVFGQSNRLLFNNLGRQGIRGA